MSHTPGPWEAIDNRQVVTVAEVETGRTYGYGCENDFVCDLNDGEYHEYRNEKEQAANARLIAAAPELLAELKCVLASFADEPRIGSVHADKIRRAWFDRARAAIAKAEGEA